MLNYVCKATNKILEVPLMIATTKESPICVH